MKYLRVLTCLWLVFALCALADPVRADVVPPVDAVDMQLVGQFGGASYAVALQGTYAYVGVGPRLVVLDVSDPANLVLVGQTEVLPDIVKDVAVATGYAYVAAGARMFVVDIADPAAPAILGFCAAPDDVNGVVVSGSYAYLAVKNGSLRVVDVSTPATPSEIGSHVVAASAEAQSVAVAGNFAYVVAGNTLYIVNVTTPSSPSPAGSLPFTQPLQDVVVVGSTAYVAAGSLGLRIVNVAAPATPAEVGFYDTPGSAYGVTVVNSYAYVADGYQGLQIIDVAVPSTPVFAGDAATHELASDVAVMGTYAYVADRFRGLRAFNVSTPASPVEIGHYDIVGNARRVLPVGNLLYVADADGGLRILNVSNPMRPREIGHYDSPGNAASVSIAGKYAYVTDGLDLRIVDISVPSAPVPEPEPFETYNGWAYVVIVQQDFAFIAEGGGAKGLHVASLANPVDPITEEFVDTSGDALDLAIVGQRAYLAADVGGLRIVDISAPVDASLLGFWDVPDINVSDVAVEGTLAYVVDGQNLYAVDTTNPVAPTSVMTWTTAGSAEGVTVLNSIAYLAEGHAGLRLLDVAEPSAPEEIGYYNTPGEALYSALANQYIYVADGHGGVIVLWYGPLASGTVSTGGGAFTSEFDGTTYYFPTGAFTDTIILRHAPIPAAVVPSLGDLSGINHFFNTTAVYSSTGQLAQLVPGTVFTISVAYTPEERGVVADSTLALYYWDGDVWSTEGITKVTTAQENMVFSRLDHLTLFGVLGESRSIYLPLVMRAF
ncbi:MAG: hypothetical protein ACP5J4_00175 [Anaerolineae bacterium]